MAAVKCATLLGIGGRVLDVTASAASGPPGLEQLGLPGPGKEERAGRVRAAVTASGLPWPESKITVTVLPGGLPKHSHAVDLAVAVAVLAAGGRLPDAAARNVMCCAGLGPDGRHGRRAGQPCGADRGGDQRGRRAPPVPVRTAGVGEGDADTLGWPGCCLAATASTVPAGLLPWVPCPRAGAADGCGTPFAGYLDGGAAALITVRVSELADTAVRHLPPWMSPLGQQGRRPGPRTPVAAPRRGHRGLPRPAQDHHQRPPPDPRTLRRARPRRAQRLLACRRIRPDRPPPRVPRACRRHSEPGRPSTRAARGRYLPCTARLPARGHRRRGRRDPRHRLARLSRCIARPCCTRT